MAQHFLKSAKVRDFTLWDASNLTEDEAFSLFCKYRWGTENTQICPRCGVIDSHYVRKQRREWRCKHCKECFSATKGTPFQDRKISFKKLIMGIILFSQSSAGISLHLLARNLDVQIKTAQVLVGKIREAILIDRQSIELLAGTVHIDGGYFGGRPRNGRVRRKSQDKDRESYVQAKIAGDPAAKKARNKISKQNYERRKNRRVVMVIRELHPEKGMGACKTIIAVSLSEDEKTAMILARSHIQPDTIIMSDENAAYNRFSTYFDHQTVEHAVEFSTIDGVSDNQAESYFSRLRQYARGIGKRIEPKYLADIATEMAWREDVRRWSEREKLENLLSACFKRGLSRWWRGYWQGYHREDEIRIDN